MGIGPRAAGARPKALRPTQRWFKDATPPHVSQLPLHAVIDVRLLIDASGQVTDCKVVGDRRSPGFADATCQRIRSHIRFDPARDEAGLPVATYYAPATGCWPERATPSDQAVAGSRSNKLMALVRPSSGSCRP
ncbi:energy transducer TonB [Novosphingobium sp. BL-8A]|uniref:energy transducer TonB n=1 Tax=Novosphingobium sp. BL-8A TaxID=3127639 RepID=UPI0037572C84